MRHYVLLLRDAMRAAGRNRPASDLLEIDSALLQCGTRMFASRTRRPPPRGPPVARPGPSVADPPAGPMFEGGGGPDRIEIDLTEGEGSPEPAPTVGGAQS